MSQKHVVIMMIIGTLAKKKLKIVKHNSHFSLKLQLSRRMKGKETGKTDRTEGEERKRKQKLFVKIIPFIHPS